MNSDTSILVFLAVTFIPCAIGVNSELRVAVCSEGYPPYVEVQGSNYLGFELGDVTSNIDGPNRKFQIYILFFIKFHSLVAYGLNIALHLITLYELHSVETETATHFRRALGLRIYLDEKRSTQLSSIRAHPAPCRNFSSETDVHSSD